MNKKSIVKSVLSQNGYLPVNRTIIKQLGLDEAALLAVLVDGEDMFGNDNGWFYCTAETIKDILNMKRTQYESALKNLASHNIFESKLMGVPAKKFFHLDYDVIFDILDKGSQFAENQQTRMLGINNQERLNSANTNKEYNNKENIIVKENKPKEIFDADVVEVVEDDGFETFWDLYDKKRGKDACMKVWAKLSQKDRDAAISYIPAYKAAQPDKQYRKDPLTFLHQKSWNDEIIESNSRQHMNTSGNAMIDSAIIAEQVYQNLNF